MAVFGIPIVQRIREVERFARRAAGYRRRLATCTVETERSDLSCSLNYAMRDLQSALDSVRFAIKRQRGQC